MPDLEALRVLMKVAEERGRRVLLIGAMARQLIFDDRYEGRPYRATLDIDAAVRVANWAEYDDLVDELTRATGFTRHGDHRFRYRDQTEVDLLPFGGVADADGNLIWQGGDQPLSLEGLEVADANSEEIETGGITVRVASLPSLIALKLYAFRDRFSRTSNDLRDLVYIVEHATDVLSERAYLELGEELADLEYRQLGPFLLGRDIARIVSGSELVELQAIVERQILDAPDHAALNRVLRGAGVDEIVILFTTLHEAMTTPPKRRSPER